MVGRPSESAAFAALCLLTLILVAVIEVMPGRHSSVGSFAFIPVIAAAWYLSPRLSLVVAISAVLLRTGVATLGAVEPMTALAQVLTIPALALLSRTAAVNILKNATIEQRVSQMEASKERVAELEKAKSEFLRLASHELRGPVGVIRGYLSMLEDGELGELPPAARAVLPVLAAKARTVNQLIEQMMETARLEDSRLQLDPVVIDLGGLVERSLAYIRPLADERHHFVHTPAGRPVEVVVDAGRLGIIVNNLLENAVKYSPEGGEINIRVIPGGRDARVIVADHGLGIPAAEMCKLFTRFGRVVTDATRSIPGTGLGLYLARELARLHGGDLLAQSVHGEGSTFTLLIPVAARAPKHLIDRLAA